MATARSRRLSRRLRARVFARRALLETLEERTLLSAGPPQILSHDLPPLSDTAVAAATLMLSEPVVASDAGAAETYEVLRVGGDQQPGGGDDALQILAPSYTEGATQIDLELASRGALSLSEWSQVGPSHGWGGYWNTDTHALRVETASSPVGDPSFFISSSDVDQGTFQTRLRISASDADDLVGVVFGMQRYEPASGFRPNNYYCLTWKHSTETTSFTYYSDVTAEEGLKLIRAESVSGWPDYMIGPFLWDGVYPGTGSRLEVLDASLDDDKGWEYDTDYEITVDYASDGTIDLVVRRVDDDTLIWSTTVVDSDPLGPGRIGFFNMGQPGTEYRTLGTTAGLGEGLYQLTARSGDPGLHDLDGLALDGDGDNTAGGDFTAWCLVDFNPPEIVDVQLDAESVVVTYADLGGMDHARMTDVENYDLIASGGDGAMGDEDDVTIAIADVTWRAGDYGYEQAVLSFAAALDPERYRLTVDGTDGVRDRYGRDLLGGDFTDDLYFSPGPTQVVLDLPSDMDTGVSSDDNLTRLTSLDIDLVIDRPGRIRLDLDDDRKYEIDEYLSASGTYTYPAPFSSDGEHRCRAYFDPAHGSNESYFLYVTIDTVAPSVAEYAPFGAGHVSADHVEFQLSEALAGDGLTLTDLGMTGPVGTIPLTGLTDLGENTYRVAFAEQTAWGVYQLAISPRAADPAGNQIDTDGDGLGGEELDDALNLNFLIGFAGLNETVDGSFESAGAGTGPPSAVGTWSGDHTAWSGAFGSVAPADGTRMLRFRNTGSSAAEGVTWGDVWQLIDLAPFADDLATGEAMVWASALFNRGEGTVNWDTQFSVSLAAYAGDPATFPTQLDTAELAATENFLFTDNEAETWQGLSTALTLPATADFVVLKLSAIENVYDRGWGDEFFAHFVDAARAVVVVPLDKPYVIDSSPQGSIATAVDHIDLTFDEAIDPDSFTADDVLLVGPDGGHAVDAPRHLGDNVWRISFAPLAEEGDYQYAIGPDVRDLDGRPMDQNRDGGAGDPDVDVYRASFRIDFTPLVVSAHTPAGLRNTFISHLDVTFSEAIEGATFTPDDVTLNGPAGPISVLDPVHQDGNTWRIPFAEQQTEGEYALAVGPDIDDLAGHPMLEPYSGAFEIRLANLVASALEVPAVGGSGHDLAITWQVANDGVAATYRSWIDAVYLSDDDALGDDTLLASFDGPVALEDGKDYDRSVTVTLPHVDEGDYWIVVVVDGNGEIDEPAESDNVLIGGPVIVRRPNLTVGSLEFPSEASPGERGAYSCMVSNTGAVPTTGYWYVTAYLSEDEVLDGDPVIGNFAAPPDVLGPGEHYDRTGNWDLPDVPPGDYFVIVHADRSHHLPESDETDNIAVAGTIDVKSLDLVVTDLELPTGSQSGEEVTLRWRLQNNGSGTVTGYVADFLYVQNQTTHEFWRWYVGYQPASRGPIGPGESVVQETTFSIPEGTDGTGDFWVQIETDIVDSLGHDRVYEWNPAGDAESNNKLDGTFHATLAVYPDLVIGPVAVAPETPQTGEAITVDWRLENDGNAPVKAAFADRVRVVNTTTGQTLLTEFFPYDPSAQGAIAVGAGVDRQLTVTLPEGSMSVGDLSVSVRLDGDDDIFEHNESGTGEENNEANRAVTATLAPYPNLAVTAVDFPELTIGDPATVTIDWTLENLGTGDALLESWTDVIVISENDVLGDWDDRVLLQREHLGGLAAGASYPASQEVLLPPRFEGRFYLFVTTDVNEVVFEDGSEANNTLKSDEPFDVVRLPYADLVVSSVQVPASGYSGQPIDLSWTVTNQGIGPTNEHNWRDYVYLAHDPAGEDPIYETRDDSEVLWYENVEHLGQLPVGASYTHRASLTLPEGLAGTVYAVVSTAVMPQAILASFNSSRPYSTLEEFVYDDNNESVGGPLSVQLTPPPDLVVTEVGAPSDASEDTLIDVSWSVDNEGLGEATGGWVDRAWLQHAADPDADPIELGTFTYSVPLPSGARYTRQELVRIPPQTVGTYYLAVTTDRADQVFEHTREDNNTTVDEAPLTIGVKPRPDLQVTSITAPATVDPEGSLSVEFVIVNQDTVATTRAHWVDRVYLSLDDQIGGSDLLIDTMANQSALGPGESYLSVSAAGIVPRHFRGDMFVLVQTDAYGQMNEWPNEGNNVLAVPLHVTEMPLADLVVSDVVVPSQAIAGSEIEIRFTVTNLGAGETDRDWWNEQIWLCADKDRPRPNSSDWQPKLDRLLSGLEHRGSLEVEGGYDATVTVTLPPDLVSGRYYLTPWTDPYRYVSEDTLAINVNPDDPEEIDNNNYKARSIDIIALAEDLPDLAVESVVATPETEGGGDITVSYTVRNEGSLEAAEWHPYGFANQPGPLYWMDDIRLVSDLEERPEKDLLLRHVLVIPPDGLKSPLVQAVAGGVGIDLETGLEDGTVIVLNEPLGPGESYTHSITVPLSPSADGAHALVVTDAGNFDRLEEADETNNEGSGTTLVTPIPANLTVTAATVEPLDAELVYSGEPARIRYTVTNVGEHPVWAGTDYWKEHLWLSADVLDEWIVSGGDPSAYRASYLGETVYAHNMPLQPGASYDVECDVVLPSGIGGDYYVYIHLNSSGKELNTKWWPAASGDNSQWLRFFQSAAFEDPRDNLHRVPVPVVYREPDLVVTSLDVPATATSGDVIDVSYRVSNQGTRATRIRSGWVDGLILSSDAFLDVGDVLLSSERVILPETLKPGASYTATRKIQLPETIEGDFHILAFTDSVARRGDLHYRPSSISDRLPGISLYFSPLPGDDRVTRERRDMTRGAVWEFEDEGNNVASAPLAVSLDVPPDLQVTALSAPERLVRGQPFEVTWTVTNLGGDTPPDQGSWENLIYLSRDEVLDLKADRYVASQGHSGGLGAAESDTRTVTVTAPKDLLGPYYVFAVADPVRHLSGGSVQEPGNEYNNDRATPVPLLIELPPPSDLAVTEIVIPGTVTAGEAAPLAWTVTNTSSRAAAGSWSDSVYLSADAL